MKNYPLIEICDQRIDERSGISAKSNQPYCIREQDGFLFLTETDKYPEKIKISLDDKAPAFGVGMYSILPESYVVNKFKSLSIGRLRLQLVAGVQAKAS